MIAVQEFSGKAVGVFGLARSGLSAARALKAGGAKLFAWDDNEAARQSAAKENIALEPHDRWPWPQIKTLVLSPGIPLTHPVVRQAQKAGAEVIGDVELFARVIRSGHEANGAARIIAVTGTNGKSTTTALIGHILQAAGLDAQVGGNIGKPVLDLGTPTAKTVYVLEVSSYQIELSPGLAPDVAVLTNLSPDHIDRHGSMANYAAVKESLLKRAAPDGHVAVGVDDDYSAAIYTKLVANRMADAVAISIGKVLGRGIFVIDGKLYDAWDQPSAQIGDLKTAAHLPGTHNWQNAALAYSAVRRLIRDPRAIFSSILRFPGLAHRIEDVGRIGKIRFVNDSKATNAAAAARALACFPDIFWIAGGRAKEGGIADLSPYFPQLRKVYLIGEAAESFGKTLAGKVAAVEFGTLERALKAAFDDVRASKAEEPVILLSPACASFDQFKDFEHRGDVFRDLRARTDFRAGETRARWSRLMILSRADNSGLARWWWTIDRVAFAGMLGLMAIGLVLAFAASPTATGNTVSAGNFSYALKQIAFCATAIVILVGTSMIDSVTTRIAAAAIFALGLIGAWVALVLGVDINGAHRWLDFGGLMLEPSEFLKPAFAVLAAAFLADKLKRGFPGELVTIALLVPAIVVLLLQPDVGQTLLLSALCVVMLFLAGLAYYWLVALGAGGALLALLAYFLHPHVRERIGQFFNEGPGYQTGLALQAFEAGGVTGVGPGAGSVKFRLPDAHTDFILAVAGEEFGIALCILIALLFGFVTIRLLLRASKARDPFAQLAASGLAIVVGLQAFINMGVSLSILPAKGMTLPLISYGGSSLFAVALTLGLALGLTRQRPALPEEIAR